MQSEVDYVFFDIGGTLGDRDAVTGKLAPFPSTAGMLAAMHNQLGLRLGIITTLGSLTNAEGRALLHQAGIAQFLDPHGFFSEHDAGVAKPDLRIYRFAAQRVGVLTDRCLFVGENLIEVIAATAAGMKALLKPSPPGRELPA